MDGHHHAWLTALTAVKCVSGIQSDTVEESEFGALAGVRKKGSHGLPCPGLEKDKVQHSGHWYQGCKRAELVTRPSLEVCTRMTYRAPTPAPRGTQPSPPTGLAPSVWRN